MTTRIYGNGTRTLSVAQVNRLAAKVGRRLDRIGDPAIRAPLAGDYLAERHFSPCNHFDLAVDIDIGFTVLTLRAGANWPKKPELGPGTDLVAMSASIAMIVDLARNDVDGFARLAAMEDVVRAKIKRDGLGLELISVRFAPAPIYHPEATRDRACWVTLGLLDDMLLPYTDLRTEQSTRRMCRELKRIGTDQTRRRQALERLASLGAVLEIDATAEHAIAIAGRSVGDVAREMFDIQRPGGRDGRRVTLWGDPKGQHVSVAAHGGCIGVEASIGPLDWTHHSGIMVDRVFPETITMALVGRPFQTLTEHPYLQGDAEIVGAVRSGDSRTEIRVRADARPISYAEIAAAA